jgi:hypothetical protein
MNLATYLTRARDILQDTNNLAYTDAELTAALRLALAEYNSVRPRLIATTVLINTTNTIPAPAGQTLAIRHIDNNGNMDDVIKSWQQIDQDTNIHIIDASADILPGESVRLWYTDPSHTINGLDSATTTTIQANNEHYIITGLCSHAINAEQIDAGEIIDETRLNRTAKSLSAIWNAFLKRMSTTPYNIPTKNGITGFYTRFEI